MRSRVAALALLLVTTTTTMSDLADGIGVDNLVELLLRKVNYLSTKTDQSFFAEGPILAEYDFVVVGSGAGGSVVASRLTEIPHWSVLLLEAGREESVLLEVPLLVNYLEATDFNWGYKSEAQDGACLGMKDRKCRLRQGKSLGGTTSINDMVYARGDKSDYDSWSEMGNTGWAYDQVLPYFLKSERNRIQELENSTRHFRNGSLWVEYPPYSTPLGNAFVEAGIEMGRNRADYNDGTVSNGFSRVQATMRRGHRVSASRAFLRPAKTRANLRVSTKSRATKLLIDPESKAAYGVEFVKNRRRYRVTARKEIILSGGAVGSAQLLMLSGIGPKEHLRELGITVVQDLKVGHNLLQQVSYPGLTFLVNQTYTGLLESRLNTPAHLMTFFNREGKGPLTVPGGVEGLAYVRTKVSDDATNRPDVELIFLSGSLTSDNGGALRRGIGVSDEVYNKAYRPVEGRDSWSMTPVLLRPRSRGRMTLKSSNPWHWPIFRGNYLSDDRDVDALVEGIKAAIDVSKTRAFQKYGSYLNPLPVPGCASRDSDSDDYWRCAVRHLTSTAHTLAGTCKMGAASDPDAVVSPELKVRGIANLRVVDESVMPDMITGHVAAAAYMIGEKGSDLIKSAWGQNGPATEEAVADNDVERA